MTSPRFTRRQFLQGSSCVTAGWVLAQAGSSTRAATASGADPLHLASNVYSWHVFYRREGKDFGAMLDEGLSDVKASGIDGYEPSVASADEVRKLGPLLKKAGLEMRSLYVGSTLHSAPEAEQSIEHILEIARAAKEIGTRIIVTNPNPIRWGGTQPKDDTQLRVQAGALERLGRALNTEGLRLAYHNHDIELKNAAREFHHMMAGTDPQLVTLCLDAHWVFRGSGNSQVALFDVVKLYGSRVTEVHLRQSQNGTWSETFGPGDIDYEGLVQALRGAGATPHWVLEVAVENGTPKTLTPREAHRMSVDYAQKIIQRS